MSDNTSLPGVFPPHVEFELGAGVGFASTAIFAASGAHKSNPPDRSGAYIASGAAVLCFGDSWARMLVHDDAPIWQRVGVFVLTYAVAMRLIYKGLYDGVEEPSSRRRR